MRRLLSPGKIAIHLATAGEKYPAQIAKETGLSNGRIGDAIPRLLKFGLIKRRELGKWRTGLAVIGYSLTLKGLAEALYAQPDLWEKMDIIAPLHRELLPLIFGKWDYFIQAKIRDFVFTSLKRYLGAVAYVVSTKDVAMNNLPMEILPSIAKTIEDKITGLILIPDHRQRVPDEWKDAIAGDPEIAQFVMAYLEKEDELFLKSHNQRQEWRRGIAQKLKTRAPRSQKEEGKKERKKEVKK